MFAILYSDFIVCWRALAAFSLALILSLLFGGKLIDILHKYQKTGQPIREDGPKSHLETKKGTPTMGGILILSTSIISILLFANISYHFVWVSLLILLMYGLTGFVDDYWKVKRRNSNAMTAKMKLFLQFLTATIAASIITAATPRGVQTVLNFPNFENILLIVLLFGFPLIFEFCLLINSGGSFPKNTEERISIHTLIWPLCLALYVLIGAMMYKNGNFSFTGAINTLIDLMSGENSGYHLPTIKRFFINLSWLYVPFAVIVISGTSNAVNLSDGLDGLASGLLIIAFTFFGIVAYLCGLHNAIDYNTLFIPRCSEIAVVCASLVGACLGFLYFNKPKARVFMGDTGSLALGAILGTIAVMTKQEVLLAIVGCVFVAETVSVMIQVIYFKTTGKRFFRMAPIHHHFEQLGWSEKKVVLSFWLTALSAALVGSLVFL